MELVMMVIGATTNMTIIKTLIKIMMRLIIF